jgi:hypothetical protein
LNIGAAIQFPFRGQHWLPNLAMLMVCLLIPVIGPMVAMGYGVLVQRMLVADALAEPPRFDFGMFTEHLKRGLPPFVVGLIFLPVSLVVIFGGWGAMIVGLLLLQKSVALGITVILVGILLCMVLIVVAGVAILPLMMKAALEGTIGGAFDWGFAKDFYRRVGLLTLGTQLLFFLLAFLMMPLGCVPLIGPAVMQTMILMMIWNVHAQLYQEYVARGGRTLVIPVEPAPPPAVYGFPTVQSQQSGETWPRSQN